MNRELDKAIRAAAEVLDRMIPVHRLNVRALNHLAVDAEKVRAELLEAYDLARAEERAATMLDSQREQHRSGR